ncbi:CpxP family protein [Vibrio hippocampi]|uniref:Stress adaptor protein CpxP n=1 Tax=Vibrio hippocampi TaxID=654686 RepID=A0ABM8ZE03_9VIBR|nr:CpxP family protein [Vibrio hippocampi]CAH0524425.1 hypothetical protein VHP8226_00252 [Vibrio hippocampi]
MKFAKKLVIAATVLPLAFGSVTAMAKGGPGGQKGGMGKGEQCMDVSKGMFRQLDLTDEQQEQLKELRNASREARRAERSGDVEVKKAEMMARHSQMQSVLLADTFDAQAAQSLATEMVEKQAQRRVGKMEQQHKMLSVLTAEQKTKLQELQQQRLEKCMEKMGKRAERIAAKSAE